MLRGAAFTFDKAARRARRSAVATSPWRLGNAAGKYLRRSESVAARHRPASGLDLAMKFPVALWQRGARSNGHGSSNASSVVAATLLVDIASYAQPGLDLGDRQAAGPGFDRVVARDGAVGADGHVIIRARYRHNQFRRHPILKPPISPTRAELHQALQPARRYCGWPSAFMPGQHTLDPRQHGKSSRKTNARSCCSSPGCCASPRAHGSGPRHAAKCLHSSAQHHQVDRGSRAPADPDGQARMAAERGANRHSSRDAEQRGQEPGSIGSNLRRSLSAQQLRRRLAIVIGPEDSGLISSQAILAAEMVARSGFERRSPCANRVSAL